MKKYSIEDMNKLAKTKGGKCLSKEYVNTHTKLRWRCKGGHVWEAQPSHIRSGEWCPVCARINRGLLGRLSIEEMRELAKKKGGKCLSKNYVNSQTKLKWQCKQGHIWEAIPSNIKSGHWCPVCAGVATLSIEEMRKLAKKKGGKCLSKKYVNARTKLKWRCKEGHVWEAMSSDVKGRGTWCPVCARNKKKNK